MPCSCGIRGKHVRSRLGTCEVKPTGKHPPHTAPYQRPHLLHAVIPSSQLPLQLRDGAVSGSHLCLHRRHLPLASRLRRRHRLLPGRLCLAQLDSPLLLCKWGDQVAQVSRTAMHLGIRQLHTARAQLSQPQLPGWKPPRC